MIDPNRKVPGRGLALFLACLFWMPQAAQGAPTKATVFGTPAVKQKLFDVLLFPARIFPRTQSTLLSETEGRVVKIHKPLGQFVKKGQTLLVIQHTDPIYQYAPFQVLAPVAGTLSQLDVTEGSQVSKGQKLGMVTDDREVFAKFEVPPSDLSVLKLGSIGEFSPQDSLQNGTAPTIAVRLTGLSQWIDPSSGTASAEAEFKSIETPSSTQAPASKTIPLRPGQVGRITFKVNEREGLTVLDSALFYKGNEPQLRIFNEGKIHLVSVKLGRRQQGTVEIVEGLEPGSFVVERASRFVSEGDEVEAQK